MAWLTRFFRKSKLESQFDSELQFHVEQPAVGYLWQLPLRATGLKETLRGVLCIATGRSGARIENDESTVPTAPEVAMTRHPWKGAAERWLGALQRSPLSS
jgi:hypothetical protein